MARNKNHNQRGFTLIEMSVVIVILGLGLASAAQLYKQWIRYERAETTRQNVSDAVDAITAYRDLYGHYPCPAPLTASRENMNAGTATYGAATDCSNTTGDYAIGAGVTAVGISSLNSARPAYAYKDLSTMPATPATAVPRIRIGALPFRTLNAEEDKSYDGYGNRLFYAVTDQLTQSNLFDPLGGGIGILNDNNVTAIEPVNSAHFIIFSAGENGAGAYTRGGNALPCTATATLESENCNIIVDTQFRVAAHGTAGDGAAGQFDDVVAYATHKDVPLWEVGANPLDTSRSNMTMKVPGGVGIGASASQNPDEQLDVEGILRAQDNPLTTSVQEGNIGSLSICDYASGSSTCFPSSLIAGDLETSTGGLACPSGQYMIGIKFNAPVCVSDVSVRCHGNETMTGLNADGTLQCSGPPPRCPTTQVNLCGETLTLFEAAPGTETVLNAGHSYRETYRCRWSTLTWQSRNDGSGECTCTPDTQPPEPQSCADWSWECGERFGGNRTIQREHTCDGRGDITNILDETDCHCIPSSRTERRDCPHGLNSGEITVTNTHDCTTNQCSGWVETGNTCACSPVSWASGPQPCPSGLDGTIIEEYHWTCPSGASSPGTWGAITYPSGHAPSDCQCHDDSYTINDGCPPGYEGVNMATYTKTCPNTNYVRTQGENTCQPIPPEVINCYWTIPSGTYTEDFPSAKRDGELCICGSDPNTCSAPATNGKHRKGLCECKQR